jgi:hypothetical protein
MKYSKDTLSIGASCEPSHPASSRADNQLAVDPGRRSPATLLWRFMTSDVREGVRRARRRLGLHELRDLTPDAYRAPDSPLAKAALELATSVSPPLLLNHALRTYHFGAILAARDGLRLDRELFFMAAVLHDLGLTESLEAEPGSFEWVGARRARAFGLEQGMARRRADLLHDAIALHSSVGIAHRREPEVAMVHYGAGVDVLGMRIDEIPATDLDHVLEAWPRCGFKKDFPGCLERQTALKPNCHIAGMVRLGFDRRVRATPFAE